MKNIYLIIVITLIFFMLLTPLLSLKTKGGKKAEATHSSSIIEQKEPIVNNTATIKVLKSESGEIENIAVSDYIFGVVAAEMPAAYEEEALKAQAVAAYTFALYRTGENAAKEYDITDLSSTDQKYISQSAAREKWGEKADEYEKKIRAAVAAVEGEYICFEGKPALALYHAISGGKTESCAAVFGQDLPYLVTRDSIGDLLDPNYTAKVSFSDSQFATLVSERVKLSGEAKDWIGEVKRRSNGYVESVEIGGTTLTGTEIRSIFSLRSANFDITAKDSKVDFTVRGYGHGVGMSQSGAQYMAEQGGTYREILFWYYPDCEIAKN